MQIEKNGGAWWFWDIIVTFAYEQTPQTNLPICGTAFDPLSVATVGYYNRLRFYK